MFASSSQAFLRKEVWIGFSTLWKWCLQDKATAGKQGLGIKDQPKKIAGVRYQGKKTSFDNSDDDDDTDEEEEEEEESEKEDDKDSVIENALPAERKREESEEEDDKDSVIAKRKRDEITEPKIKLKNLCKQILKKVCCQFQLWAVIVLFYNISETRIVFTLSGRW